MPTKAPGQKNRGRNLELHLMSSQDSEKQRKENADIFHKKSKKTEESSLLDIDRNCICELDQLAKEKITERENAYI